MEEERVKIIKNGQEILCETLVTFDCAATGRHYIAYTDHSTNEAGDENIYISAFDPSMGTSKLQDLDVNEQKMANELFNQIKTSL